MREKEGFTDHPMATNGESSVTTAQQKSDQIDEFVKNHPGVLSRHIKEHLKMNDKAFHTGSQICKASRARRGNSTMYWFGDKPAKSFVFEQSNSTESRRVLPVMPILTRWAGSNPFEKLRTVHSCSGADMAYVNK
jgi:hypothetical protein